IAGRQPFFDKWLRLTISRCSFFVDTLHKFWIGFEQKNWCWLIFRRREIEDAERNDLLWKRRVARMQDKKSIVLANLELAGLNFRLSGFRVHQKPQSCFL